MEVPRYEVSGLSPSGHIKEMIKEIVPTYVIDGRYEKAEQTEEKEEE